MLFWKNCLNQNNFLREKRLNNYLQRIVCLWSLRNYSFLMPMP